MSPSGAEVLRQIKSEIEQVDPGAVHESLAHAANGTLSTPNGNGSSPNGTTGPVAPLLIDVRETEEFGAGHIPGAKHVPKSYLETRIELAVPDRDAPIVLYCQSGNRSAWAARTLIDDLGYTDVASMTGGITLWKDRGYDVEVPTVAHRRAARPLLTSPADPRDRHRGSAEAAGRQGAAAGRRWAGLADRALPGRCRGGHARDRRRRRG